MVDVYGRLDTAFGENGAHLPKIAPELWGLTLDDVQGHPAGTGSPVSTVAHRMAPDRTVDEVLNDDPVGGSTEHPIPEGGEKEPFDDGTGADMLAASRDDAEARTQVQEEHKENIVEGMHDEAQPGATQHVESQHGTHQHGSAAGPADGGGELLSKTALRKMDAKELAAYASKHNVDPEGATKEQIIATLYGE